MPFSAAAQGYSPSAEPFKGLYMGTLVGYDAITARIEGDKEANGYRVGGVLGYGDVMPLPNIDDVYGGVEFRFYKADSTYKQIPNDQNASIILSAQYGWNFVARLGGILDYHTPFLYYGFFGGEGTHFKLKEQRGRVMSSRSDSQSSFITGVGLSSQLSRLLRVRFEYQYSVGEKIFTYKVDNIQSFTFGALLDF